MKKPGSRKVSSLVVCAGVLASVVGCSPQDEAVESGHDEVIVERGRIEELVKLTKQAAERSRALEASVGGLVALRDLAAAAPAIEAVNGLLRDLEPLLRLLRERLTSTPSQSLRQAGFADVSDAEYRLVIERVERMTRELGNGPDGIKRLQSDIVAFGDVNKGLSESQEAALREKVSAYVTKVFGISSELDKVSLALSDWLTQSNGGGTGTGGLPPLTKTRSLTLSLTTDVRSGPGQPRADEELESHCSRLRVALSQAFPQTLDDFDCGRATTDAQIASSTGSATFRVPETVESSLVRLSGEAGDFDLGGDKPAMRSWLVACEKFLQTVQSQTVPSRVVVAATCGEPFRILAVTTRFHSTATILVARR